ncbi:MAG TPA: hypothetical protein VEJ87_12215 [Acidimicrobiales bacterium]|nr:hypothetical protein [Acidimicrobiales bacterium]
MRTRLIQMLVVPLLVVLTGVGFALVSSSAATAAPLGSFGPTFGAYNIGAAPTVGSPTGLYFNYTCPAGAIPPGTYGSILVTGICYMPTGNITVEGDVTIAPHALLDAVTPGDPTSGTPVVPATVSIGGNVIVDQGAVLLLGCSPNISCGAPAPGISFDHVAGSIEASGAQGVVIHSTAIGGSLSITGGGGGPAAETCNAQSPAPAPPITNLEPWSLDPNFDFTPVFTDVEDSTIGGNFTISGLTSCWFGALRNQIGGSASLVANAMGDPDATEFDENLISGGLTCVQNSPAPQFGDSGAAPNIVDLNSTGQCGFGVVLQNPAPEAIESEGLEPDVGVNEHLVVSGQSLGTYTGTHTSTTVATLGPPASPLTYPVTTVAGDKIFADLGNFTFTGNGLTGSATYSGGPPGQSPGEAILGTAYPTNGTVSFVAYDTCPACSFGGQTGMVTLRFYGTIAASGSVTGTFFITSGGAALPPGTPAPGLATVAGYGTFSGTAVGGAVASLTLVEHLGFG